MSLVNISFLEPVIPVPNCAVWLGQSMLVFQGQFPFRPCQQRVYGEVFLAQFY